MTKFLSPEEYSVDPNALDKEWLRQTSLYQKYARLLAEATYRKNRLEAFLDRDIRKYPGKYGFDKKPTEPAIAMAIQGDEGFLRAQGVVNRLGGDIKALEHKKRSLERLTDLYLNGYWARPRISTEAQDFYEKEATGKVLGALEEDERMKKLRGKQ